MTGRWLRLAFVGSLLVAHRASAKGDRLAPHMTILGLTLMQSTFEDAQRRLGSAEVRDIEGDGAAHAYCSCFIGRDGSTLVLVSNSEMGQGKTVTSYQLVDRAELADYSGGTGTGYVAPREARPRCSRLERLSRASANGGGLRLGMTNSKVRSLLGKPVEESSGSMVFQTKQEKPYLLRVLRVDSVDGKVIAIRAEPDIF